MKRVCWEREKRVEFVKFVCVNSIKTVADGGKSMN